MATKRTPEYYQGLRAGVMLFAWWKDGVQYCGTCGTTLQSVLDDIDQQEENEQFNKWMDKRKDDND